MNTRNVSEIFIGAGAALDVATTNVAALTAQTAFLGKDMVVPSLTASTIALAPSIFVVNKLANGDLKRSFEIKGTNVSGYSAKKFKPACNEVWGVGFQRGYRTVQDEIGAATGYTAQSTSGITVANSTQYDLTIRFKWDKMFYSERPEVLRISFTSSSAATQSNIADQIVSAINGSAFGASASGIKCIKATKVADGSAAYGLTTATNFGVEIEGLDVSQFSNTQYAFRQVRFSVHVLDASGFDTTPCVQMVAADPGNGTYQQIANLESYNYQFEGVLNRVKFPIPTLASLAVDLTAGVTTLSADLTAATTFPTGVIPAASTGVNGYSTVTYDRVKLGANGTKGLLPGMKVTINAVAYTIKYVLDSTQIILVAPLTAVVAGTAFKVKLGYSTFVILVDDVTKTAGANVGQFSNKSIIIASPCIDAADIDPFLNTSSTADNTSAESLAIKTLLDAWMATTLLAPAAAKLYL